MVAAEMLGRKSGRGLFIYSGKPPKRLESSEALALIDRFKVEPKAENTRERIQYRLLSRFINEAVLCLQEGILINGPVEGDIGAVFGLGFPPCLGGKCICPRFLFYIGLGKYGSYSSRFSVMIRI